MQGIGPNKQCVLVYSLLLLSPVLLRRIDMAAAQKAIGLIQRKASKHVQLLSARTGEIMEQGDKRLALQPFWDQLRRAFLGDSTAAAGPVVPMGAGASAAATASSVPMGLPVDGEYYSCPPSASAPSSSSPPSIPQSTAVKHAECPICFEPLHHAPVGVFLGRNQRRVSPQFFNLAAAREWLRSGNGFCPLTRNPITSVLEVPSILEDRDGWFKAVDFDGDGQLSRREVVECLKAQLPVDNNALDKAASDSNHWMWQQWDSDGSGFIERKELLDPQGLAAYVRTAFKKHNQDSGPPDIKADKIAWYEFWDEDDSGSLDKEEVVRALLKTLKLTHDQAQVQKMRSAIEAVWCIFDDDGSGSIERDEFLRPGDGLADTIIATVDHDR